MKQKSLLQWWLLLLCLVVGAGMTWAEDKTGTINFGSASGSTNVNATSVTGADDLGNTWSISTTGTQSFTPNSGYSQIGSSKNPASSITFTTTLPAEVNIKAFSIQLGGFTGTAGTVTLKVGETTVGTGSLNATSDVTVSSTSSATGNVLTVTVTNIVKGVKAYYISYTYSEGGTPSKPTPTLSFPSQSCNATLGETFTAPTLSNVSEVPVTYSSSKEEVATVHANTGVITLVGEGSTVITASFAGNDTYSAASASYTLTVTDPAVTTTTTIIVPQDFNNLLNGTAAGTLTATVVTENNEESVDGATVTWESSNPEVATIDDDGIVTLVAPGTTTITATYAGEAYSYRSSSGTYNLTVTDPTVTTITTIQESQDFNKNLFFGATAGTLIATVATEDGAPVQGATVTWESSNPEVATINADGVVTLVATGSTTITASYAGVVYNYRSSSASYDLTVVNTDPSAKPSGFALFSGEIEEGDYLIVYGDGALKASENTGGRLDYQAVTITNDVIEDASEDIIWHIAKSGDYWTIYNASTNSYAASTGVKNKAQLLSDGSDDKSLWTVSGTDTYEFVNKANAAANVNSYLRKNGTNGFACYSTSTGGALSLYKASGAAPVDQSVKTTVTIDASGITNTNVFDGTAAGTLTATVATVDGAPVQGATVTWTSDNEEVATISEQGSVTLVGAGIANLMASYAGVEGEYKPSSATYSLTVTNSDPNAPGLTKDNPYTVAQARAAIDAGTGVEDVYAKGVVSKIVMAYNSQYGNITYDISQDGSENADQLRAYRGVSYNGDNFTSEDDIQVGDEVVVYGNLIKYGDIYEFAQGNQLVSLNRVERPATPTFSPEAGSYTSVQSVTITTETEDAAIYYTTDGTEPTVESSLYSEPIDVNADMTIKAIAVKNGLSSAVATAEYEIDLTPSIIFDGNNVNPYNVSCDQGYTNVHYVASNITGNISLVLCDAEGNPATYDWFRAEITSEVYVKVEWDANEDTENARTAYFKLVAENAQSVPYAIIQAKFVADYATLPFAFDGGNGGISTTSGLTQEGLASDYNSSPKLKFDSTGDWMILKINEAPGTLTFDIKGNTFSGGTFTVQTSEDGTTYTDLETYTDLGSTQSEEFNNLGENVRYIKWIYTEKSSGNVALGNITLAKYVEPIIVPTITVDPATVNVDADTNNGTLALTYENLTITEMSDFGVQYYNVEGEEISKPDWVEALVAQEQDGSYVVSYVINSNTGAERTAYFKVYASQDEESFYSNLVTVTQAEYVEPFQEATYTLAKFIVPGKHYIIVSVSGEKAMGAQNTNNRAAVKVEISDEKATVSSPDVREFVIAGPNADGFYTIYDKTEDGYLYAASSGSNYLKTEATPDANALWSISFDDDGKATVTAQGKNSRNEMKYNSGSDIFSCYASGQQAIYLYGKDGDEGVQNVTVTVTAAGYATFVSDYALDYEKVENLEAYTAEVEGTDITFTRVNTVPAGEGVLLKGVEGTVTTYEVPVVAPSFEGWKNDFIRGTGATVPSYKDGKYNYILNKVDDIVGFFKANDQVVAKDRAYLQSTESASRMNISFADDATGISEMLIINDQKGAIYNLSGQRVAAPAKGLYITNGKKFVVK